MTAGDKIVYELVSIIMQYIEAGNNLIEREGMRGKVSGWNLNNSSRQI